MEIWAYPIRVRPPFRLLLAAVAAAGGILALACPARERAAGPLPQEAYVWQRAWTPAVREAVGQASGFAGLTVLAAEIDLSQSPVRVFRVGIDWQALRDSGRPVGIALRIGRFHGWGGGTGEGRGTSASPVLRRSISTSAGSAGAPRCGPPAGARGRPSRRRAWPAASCGSRTGIRID